MLCRQCSTEGLIEMCVSCAQARIADLEKQLAEQTKRAEIEERNAERNHLAACQEKERAEAAEKRVAELLHDAEQTHAALEHHAQRVAELQVLVDAATDFTFGRRIATTYKPGDRWFVWDLNQDDEHPNAGPLGKDEAIALARELAAKEQK